MVVRTVRRLVIRVGATLGPLERFPFASVAVVCIRALLERWKVPRRVVASDAAFVAVFGATEVFRTGTDGGKRFLLVDG